MLGLTLASLAEMSFRPGAESGGWSGRCRCCHACCGSQHPALPGPGQSPAGPGHRDTPPPPVAGSSFLCHPGVGKSHDVWRYQLVPLPLTSSNPPRPISFSVSDVTCGSLCRIPKCSKGTFRFWRKENRRRGRKIGRGLGRSGCQGNPGAGGISGLNS